MAPLTYSEGFIGYDKTGLFVASITEAWQRGRGGGAGGRGDGDGGCCGGDAGEAEIADGGGGWPSAVTVKITDVGDGEGW